MPDDSPAPFDFTFGASPGGDWPAIMGSPGSESSPEGGTGGGSGSASYELVYAWGID